MKKKDIKITDSDDSINLFTLTAMLNEEVVRNKKKLVDEIESMGDFYLDEISMKNKTREIEKQKLISFILTNAKYSENDLLMYSYEDVKQIFDEVVHNKKSKFVKFIRFIFNIN